MRVRRVLAALLVLALVAAAVSGAEKEALDAEAGAAKAQAVAGPETAPAVAPEAKSRQCLALDEAEAEDDGQCEAPEPEPCLLPGALCSVELNAAEIAGLGGEANAMGGRWSAAGDSEFPAFLAAVDAELEAETRAEREPRIQPLDEWTQEVLERQEREKEKAKEKHQTPSDGEGEEVEETASVAKKASAGDVGVAESSEAGEPKEQDAEANAKREHNGFDYASFDCGAKVRASNREAQSASAIIVDGRDKYMLNPCGSADMHVVVELCDEILVEEVSLANHEFFSSTTRAFEVLGSQQLPAREWVSMGVFEAANARTQQYFSVPQPMWAKFVKVRFLSHYGSEYFCTVSEVEVKGLSLVDDLKAQLLAEEDAPPPPPEADDAAAGDDDRAGDKSDAEDAAVEKPSRAGEDAAVAGGEAGPSSDERSPGNGTAPAEPPPPSAAETSKEAEKSVFKMMSDRLKSIEQNQTMSNSYLNEVMRKMQSAMTALREDLDERTADLEAVVATLNELTLHAEREMDQSSAGYAAWLLDRVLVVAISVAVGATIRHRAAPQSALQHVATLQPRPLAASATPQPQIQAKPSRRAKKAAKRASSVAATPVPGSPLRNTTK